MRAYVRGLPENERLMALVVPEPNSGCWLWDGYCLPSGYGRFAFRGRALAAHRAAWEIFRGPIPDDFFVCHRCDTPACVNPEHLFLGTPRDNALDMIAKGRRPTRRSKARLTINQVEEIKSRLARAERVADLAREFGMSKPAIHHIKSGRNWAAI